MTLDADGEGSAQEPTVTIEEEMGRSFLSYGMSVIVSRALPDVRDGLKPVHRRIVYAMQDGGYHAGKAYKKSARIVGDVMGKYHPHGDSAIYDTMVRMAQPWSMRLPLIDGQGNYGSVDNDPPAAMRYTEARMSKAAHDLVADIDKDVVAFGPNYDGSAKEPAVVPARFPNLLVNGGTGIAVGMASNIPPHNLGEAIDACLLVLDDPDCALDALMAAMPGPDFPTAGVIKGRKGIREAYETGRGSITVSGVWSIEDAKGGRRRIVITELPYMVVKKALIEHVAALVNEKEIEGVSDVRDESDRTGMRIVIDLKREADANVVAALVAKRTDLVANFSVNATCIDQHRRPRTMGVKEMLSAFVDFRKEVVRRRTAHELGRARDRLHVVVGLYAAVSNLDRVVALIRGASDQDDARSKLVAETFSTQGGLAALILESDPEAEAGETFSLSEIQAKAILEMRLSRLTGLEREKIAGEARELSVEIAVHLGILNEPARLKDVVRNELAAAKAAYPMERLTRIEAAEMDEVSEDELIAREEVVITLTHGGYVKRTPLDAYRAQRRNGKGKSGMETKDDDFVVATAVCTTHTPLTFFTDRGIAHSLKAHKLPDAPPNAKGRPIVNFVPLLPEERVATLVAMPETEADLAGKSLMFFTDFGTVRRNAASDFAGINKAGKIAIKLDDASGNPQGKLVGVELCGDDADVMVVTRNGMAVRFHVDDVRTMQSRESTGVRAVNLAFGDAVVGASVLKRFEASTAEREAYLAGGSTAVKEDDGAERQVTLAPERMAEMAAAEQFLLTVSERGFGKRSSSHDYRTTLRGGKGITAMAINKATGPVAACFPVEAGDDVVVVTNAGQTIRTPVDGIRVQGRNTRGVGVIKLDDGQHIVDVARVEGDGSAEG